eukprot:TRINITY_DN76411_c0_g1_i1.p1 TRINITY_DN76411_c0_g1~~TRINITY_DN76411_c0_g1_i1.p1  ORF type:complete len:314 (-),score=67.12 TRINITY_DN76411_c0_g1_i1:186-1127(-)
MTQQMAGQQEPVFIGLPPGLEKFAAGKVADVVSASKYAVPEDNCSTEEGSVGSDDQCSFQTSRYGGLVESLWSGANAFEKTEPTEMSYAPSQACDTKQDGLNPLAAPWSPSDFAAAVEEGNDCSHDLEGSQRTSCAWHESASKVGQISQDGHMFTKAAGKTKVVLAEGRKREMSSICMIFDHRLQTGGAHNYTYGILDGELGPADGVGFVFDSKIRRNNIQRMRTVFLNQRGDICIRDQAHVQKLGAQVPPLAVGRWVTVHVDLDSLRLCFAVYSHEGLLGVADVNLQGTFRAVQRSGFFCAVVTKDICVSLW